MSGRTASEWERERKRQLREADQARRAAEAARKAKAKADREQHVAALRGRAERRTADLVKRVEDLSTFLSRGLTRSARIDLRALHRNDPPPTLVLGEHALPAQPPIWVPPRPPGLVSSMFGGQERHRRATELARQQYSEECLRHEQLELARQRAVLQLRAEHAQKVRAHTTAVQRFNAELDKAAEGLRQRDKRAVEAYLLRVLAAMPLPPDFPREVEVFFDARSEQASLKVALPGKRIVPTEREYQYVAARDEERALPRSAREITALYRLAISQTALLCLREVLDADPALESVTFSGYVSATNPGTGRVETPYLVSLDVTRTEFESLVLDKVQPDACLRHLHALVSPHPYELEGIEPIVDFDRKKFSFVEGIDAIATLDHRPDLMQMGYTEFEHLVKQIFEAMGMQGWTTRQSNDDGVDAVVFSPQVFVGGLSIVQAKRYSKAVGVNHVRELAGAIEEKKASKGILVTTSWFTPSTERKAREHGRMELIDGERLKYLIKEHIGKDVLIGLPHRPRQR